MKRPHVEEEDLDDSFNAPVTITIVSRTQPTTATTPAATQPGMARTSSLGPGGKGTVSSPIEYQRRMDAAQKLVDEIAPKMNYLEHLIRSQGHVSFKRYSSFATTCPTQHGPSHGAAVMVENQVASMRRHMELAIKTCINLKIDHEAALANIPARFMLDGASEYVPPSTTQIQLPSSQTSHASRVRSSSGATASSIAVHPSKSSLNSSVPSQSFVNTAPSSVYGNSVNDAVREQAIAASVVKPEQPSVPKRAAATKVAPAAKPKQTQSDDVRKNIPILNYACPNENRKYELGTEIMLRYQVQHQNREIEKLKSQIVAQGSQLSSTQQLRKSDEARYRREIEDMRREVMTQTFRMNTSVLNGSVQDAMDIDSIRMPPPSKPIIHTKPVQLGSSSKFPNASYRSFYQNTDANQVFNHAVGSNNTFVPASSQILQQADIGGPDSMFLSRTSTSKAFKKNINTKTVACQVEDGPWKMPVASNDFVEDILVLSVGLPKERFDRENMEAMSWPSGELIHHRCFHRTER